ncbi:MAG TPA: hypothetical protein VI160_10810, partial [Gemmatimonadales bacterium]
MRTTASFELFPDAPSERAIVRARWLAREGRTADAEAAYRDTLKTYPDLKAGWAEYFELLRGQGRADEALRLSAGARAQFGETAFPLALEGAALIELKRFRDALAVLERAVEADPDLAVVWHELGFAAYRLGDRNRALLALDRAFGLEPHGATLKLRGKILRDAGRYAAAEVAFEAAAQSAEHDEQWDDAEREIAVTRRYAQSAPRKPDDLGPTERWFAETGAVVLCAQAAAAMPADEALVDAFLELARDSGWAFGQVVSVEAPQPWVHRLAAGLGVPVVGAERIAAERVPLVVALRPVPDAPPWIAAHAAMEGPNTGLVFVLEHPADPAARADVVGVLTDAGKRRPATPDVARA